MYGEHYEIFVGLDVSQEFIYLCIVDEKGKIKWQGKCKSIPEDIAEAIHSRISGVEKIGLERGPLSTWHWHTLKGMGLSVVCLDAKHAQAGLKMQANRTDKTMRMAWPRSCVSGFIKRLASKAWKATQVRAMLGVRAQLVTMRVETANQIRGILKNFGIVLKKWVGKEFRERVTEIFEGKGIFYDTLRVLLDVLENLGDHIELLDR